MSFSSFVRTSWARSQTARLPAGPGTHQLRFNRRKAGIQGGRKKKIKKKRTRRYREKQRIAADFFKKLILNPKRRITHSTLFIIHRRWWRNKDLVDPYAASENSFQN